jgi:hypothetical protein
MLCLKPKPCAGVRTPVEAPKANGIAERPRRTVDDRPSPKRSVTRAMCDGVTGLAGCCTRTSARRERD